MYNVIIQSPFTWVWVNNTDDLETDATINSELALTVAHFWYILLGVVIGALWTAKTESELWTVSQLQLIGIEVIESTTSKVVLSIFWTELFTNLIL